MTEDREPADHLSGELFEAVQRNGVFRDSKRFPDAIALAPPDQIERSFRQERGTPAFDIREFVSRHFEIPTDIEVVQPDASDSIGEHIQRMWAHLRRPHERVNDHDTRIALPHPHVVPGGRFREVYYWDSYFVAEGLAADGRYDAIAEMIENFAHLIREYGYVPNGNRRYFLGRSQLPVFAKIVALLARERGSEVTQRYLPELRAEHGFWMDGPDAPDQPHETGQRVVALDGHALNRYWGGEASPRVESYREDLALGERVPESARPRLYRDIRAACESGWDFSSRWLDDPSSFESIRTTDILPVDLNASLWFLEDQLATAHEAAGDSASADAYRRAATRRREAITECFWDEQARYFFDYDWRSGGRTDRWTLAGVAPLFFGPASSRQAAGVAEAVETRFLKNGGLVTSTITSGQQWDAPNGWAPLHWMAVRGLRQYGFDDLADVIKTRWMETTRRVFERDGVLVEKYDVERPQRDAGGGEYPLQVGFAWTNAVVAAFLEEPLPGRADPDKPR